MIGELVLDRIESLTAEDFKTQLYANLMDVCDVEVCENRVEAVWGQAKITFEVPRDVRLDKISFWDRKKGGDVLMHSGFKEYQPFIHKYNTVTVTFAPEVWRKLGAGSDSYYIPP